MFIIWCIDFRFEFFVVNYFSFLFKVDICWWCNLRLCFSIVFCFCMVVLLEFWNWILLFKVVIVCCRFVIFCWWIFNLFSCFVLFNFDLDISLFIFFLIFRKFLFDFDLDKSLLICFLIVCKFFFSGVVLVKFKICWSVEVLLLWLLMYFILIFEFKL